MIHKLLAAILLTAAFTDSGAVISWQQPPGVRQTCLRRVYGAQWPAGRCWHDLEAGPFSVELPGELTHPAYKPAIHDVYILEFDGVDVGQVTLGERKVYRVYLGFVAKQNAPEVERVYLAWVGR